KFPDYEETHFNAGIFYLRHKRYDEAVEEFKSVIKFNPKNETFYTETITSTVTVI
ncbi:MAG: tetratricopeptide repeat protein, partial [Candidatus Thermochlorobacter sp.]